jgi:pantoate--beta-alanine ligase
MQTIGQVTSMRICIKNYKIQRRKVVLVPTMGALHEGHMELIRTGREIVGLKGRVVVSVFVNPTQFNQKADLKKYPRQLARDKDMCRKNGVDLIFAPSVERMYSKDFSTWVNEDLISLPLCGATRPGHFRGVCTVVAKLFNLVQPDIAVFGQKDAQQAGVIKRMVRDLNFPVKIIVAPIVREPSGLAMSSRNQRLDVNEKESASQIYSALRTARVLFRDGKTSAKFLENFVRNELSSIKNAKLDYVQIISQKDFTKLKRVKKGDLLAVALFLGKVRLIDNVIL